MEINEDKDIEKAVLEMLENILLEPKTKFNLEDRLVKDLKMDSDDISFMFILDLEKKFGFRASQEEWGKVGTVQDTINLIKKYTRLKKG